MSRERQNALCPDDLGTFALWMREHHVPDVDSMEGGVEASHAAYRASVPVRAVDFSEASIPKELLFFVAQAIYTYCTLQVPLQRLAVSAMMQARANTGETLPATLRQSVALTGATLYGPSALLTFVSLIGNGVQRYRSGHGDTFFEKYVTGRHKPWEVMFQSLLSGSQGLLLCNLLSAAAQGLSDQHLPLPAFIAMSLVGVISAGLILAKLAFPDVGDRLIWGKSQRLLDPSALPFYSEENASRIQALAHHAYRNVLGRFHELSGPVYQTRDITKKERVLNALTGAATGVQAFGWAMGEYNREMTNGQVQLDTRQIAVLLGLTSLYAAFGSVMTESPRLFHAALMTAKLVYGFACGAAVFSGIDYFAQSNPENSNTSSLYVASWMLFSAFVGAFAMSITHFRFEENHKVNLELLNVSLKSLVEKVRAFSCQDCLPCGEKSSMDLLEEDEASVSHHARASMATEMSEGTTGLFSLRASVARHSMQKSEVTERTALVSDSVLVTGNQ